MGGSKRAVKAQNIQIGKLYYVDGKREEGKIAIITKIKDGIITYQYLSDLEYYDCDYDCEMYIADGWWSEV